MKNILIIVFYFSLLAGANIEKQLSIAGNNRKCDLISGGTRNYWKNNSSWEKLNETPLAQIAPHS